MRNLLLILFSVLSLGLWAQPAPPAVSIQSGPRLNRLSWAPVAGNAIRYQIFRGTTPANKVSVAVISSATTFRDNNLTPGVRYYYEVKALEGTLSSSASNEVSAVPNRVFYVAKSNPNNQDGTESNPLLSIASALNQCMANDTLILLPGTYTEPISASKAVSIGSRFLISKNPSDKHSAVVDGFQAVGSTYFWTFPFPGANQINRISGIRFTRLNFSGLFVSGASIEDCRFDQVSNSQSNSVVLNLQAAVQFKNNQFSSVSLPNGFAIVAIYHQKDSSSFDFSGNSYENCISKSNFILFFSSGKKQELLFSRNQFRNCNLNTTLNYLGFQSGANKKVIIENNLLVKSGGLSIAADSIFLQNNTLYGFPLFGFRTSASFGKTPFAVVRNSIFQSSGLGTSTYVLGVNSGSIGTIQFENNTLGSTGQPAQAVYPGAKSGIQLLSGNLATYPQFADTLAGNFTLQSSSPAINSGKLVAGMATIDLNGNARVVSGLPDMGAYEFQGQNLSLNLELSSAARLVDLKWNGLNIPNISYKVIRTGSSGPQVLATGITLNRFADSTAVLYEPYEYQIEAMVNSTSVAFSNTQIGAANRLFYMSPAGSDNFPGSALHPKLSFAAATSRALANDTILLLPGTYSDHFYLANQQLVIGSLFLTTNDKSYISSTILSGALFSDTLPLVYDATNATSSKLIVGFTIRDGRGEALKLVKANVQNMVIENNYTYPFTIGQFPRYAVYLRNALNFSNNQILNNLNPSIWATVFFEQNSPSHDLTIHSNTFKGNFAVSNVLGVTGPMTQSVYVEANRFESNNSAYSDPDLIWYFNAGVTTASKVYIRKNLLVNNPIYRAIHFQASEQDTLFIANNTIVHNKVGIRVNANSGKQTYIANNLILRNGINTTFSQIFIGGNVGPINQKVTFLNNIISDSSMTHVLAQVANIGRVDTSGSTQNYGAKVVFVDSLNGDFRLADASPGLGGGQLLSYLATTDFSGNSIPLPAGSNPDMGCFESFNITPVLISAVPEPDGIRLSWNAVSGTGINYGVERSLNGSSFVELQRGITATSYYDSSAVLNELCSYRVFVHTGAGSSQPSNTISALRRRIWYVSTTGVNTNSGSETSPLRTIANAISRALSGDTIVLEPGNYTERINFGSKDLVIGSRYLLTFNPAFIGSTVLDGFTVSNSGVLIFSSGTVRSFPCGIVGMTITRSKTSITEIADFILRRCIIENNGSSLFPQADALLNLGGNSTIDSCIIRNNTQNLPYTLVSMPGMTSESHFENNEVYNNAVVLTTISIGGKLRIVMNNKIYSNSGGWFYGTLAIGSVPGYPASRSYIGNNLIVKNSNFGLVTLGQNNGDSAFIFNNTISENTTSGLHLNADNNCYTQLENNIFSNNGSYLSSSNISVSGTPVTLLHKAKLYNNAISPSVSSPLSVINGIEFLDILDSSGNVNFVPMYVDTTTNILNYRLQNTSKLIGAGLNSMLTPAVDLAGATRPFPLQTSHDIGCYENQGALPAPVLVETEAGNQQIRLYWERPSSPAIVRYRIYRSQSPFSNLGSATLLVEFDVKAPFHYLDTTQLQNNQTYYYSMTAGDEWGNWSLIGNQLLGIPRVPPSTPTNFVVSGGGRRIYAQWNAVPGTGIRYQLFRALGTDSLSLYKDSILQASFNDSLVVNYQKYRYAVRAVNSFNTRSGFSDTLQDFARRIFYVGVNGSNLQGGSEQYPLATFAFTVNAIQNEDTLLILPGTYHQRLPFADKAFLIAGKYLFTKDTADIFNTVINGSTLSNSVPLVFQTGNISGLRRIVGIRLTKSRGQLLALHNCKVLRIMADSNFTQPFTLNGGLIELAGEAGFDSSWVINNYQNAPTNLVDFSTNQVTGPTTVRGNLFQNNRYGSDLVYHWTTYFSGLNFQVDGNRFVRNFGDAFNAKLLFFHNANGSTGQKFFVRNNLFASNIGCAIGTSPSDNDSVFVLGNTLVNNTMGGLFLETGRAGKVWIHNNIFNNSISGNLEIGTFGPPSPNMSFSLRNNLIGFREDSFPMKDALFLNNIGMVDTFNNWGAYALFQDSSTVANYRLKVNSPAIGLGTSLAMSGTTDITGAPRNQPVGQNQDAGCYESNGRFSAPVIVASEAGDQAMELFWKRSVSSGVTRYRIYRSTQPIPDDAMTSYTYELLGQPDTYLDQQGLQNLTTYYYRLRAGNANGEWSEMSNQWIAIPRVPAPAPAQLVAKTGPRRIALSWTPVGLPNHYYQVFRDTLPNPKQLYKDSLLSSFVVDSGLVPYKTYYYKVRAVDQYNTKGYASSISGFANRIWFVDTAGSNSAFGLSDSAYKTFDFCYQVASAADTIVLNPGIYKEHFNVFLKRLVIASRYILDGNEQHIANTIIDGSNGLGTTTLITDMSNGHNLGSTEMHGLIGLTLRKSKGALIELSNAWLRRLIITDNVTQANTSSPLIFLGGIIEMDSCQIIDNLNFRPASLVGISAGFATNNYAILRNNTFQSSRYQGLALGLGEAVNPYYRIIEGNRFTNLSGQGIHYVIQQTTTSASPVNSIYRNNLIARNTGGAIAYQIGNNDSLWIEGNTITQNSSGLTMVSTTGRFVQIANNIIAHNSTNNSNQVAVQGTPKSPKVRLLFRNNFLSTSSVTNAFANTTLLHYFDTVGSIQNVGGLAVFADTVAQDYRLSSISRAIGRGWLNSKTLSFDLAGTARSLPAGSAPDMGCFEHPASITAPRLDALRSDTSTIKITYFADAPSTNRYLVYKGAADSSIAYYATLPVGASTAVYTDLNPRLDKQEYYRFRAISNAGDTSLFGNLLNAVALSTPDLLLPLNNANSASRTPRLIWKKNPEAVNYRMQLGRNKAFTSLVHKDTTTADTLYNATGLLYNTVYYWRVRANNSTGFSWWTEIDSFQTEVRVPLINSLVSNGNKITLTYNDGSATGIQYYLIERLNNQTMEIRRDTVSAGKYQFVDSTHSPGFLYTYSVKAVNLNGVPSLASGIRSIYALMPPGLLSPADFSVSGSRIPKLEWNKNQLASSYKIQLATNSNFTPLQVDTIRPDTFLQLAKLLLPNTYYYWRVQSRDSSGAGIFSQPFGFQTELSVPNFYAITAANQRLTLHFNDTGSANVVKYYIYRDFGPVINQLYDSLPGNSTSYVDSNLTNGLVYNYRISAVNAMGISSPLSIQRSGMPYEVVDTIFGNKGPRRNFVYWKAVKNNPVSYQVFRGLNPIALTLIKDALVDTFFLDTLALPQINYYYAVRSLDTLNNYSVFSRDTLLQANRIWYVATLSATNAYGGDLAPYSDLPLVLSKAQLQDTVYFFRGTYSNRVQLNGKELTLVSAFPWSKLAIDRDSTILDGSGLGVEPLVSDSTKKHFTVQGLHLSNALQVAIESQATGAGETRILDCVISKSGTLINEGCIRIKKGRIVRSKIEQSKASQLVVGGDYQANTRLHIQASSFVNNQAQEALIFANNVALENSLIANNVAPTMLIGESATQNSDTVIWINNSTLANNTGKGISLGGAGRFYCDNSILAHNSDTFDYVATTQFASLRFRNNLIEGFNLKPIPSTFTAELANNYSSGAYFQDTAAMNYRLSSVSFAIGKANAFNNPNTDLAGGARPMPMGSVADMGAFESSEAISAPRIVVLTSQADTIFFSFENSVPATKHLLLLEKDANQNWIVTDTLNASLNQWKKWGFAEGSQHEFAMMAEDLTNQVSALGNSEKIGILSTPQGFSPADESKFVSLSPEFSWTRSSFAVGYQLQLGNQVDFSGALIDTLVEDTALMIPNLLPNTVYFWRVRGRMEQGFSSWGQPLRFTTRFESTDFDSLVAGNKHIALYWHLKDKRDMSGVRIYRASNSSFSDEVLVKDTANSDAVSFVDRNLKLDTSYWYRLVTYNVEGTPSEPGNGAVAIPFNTKPVAAGLRDTAIWNAGRNYYVNLNFSSLGTVDPDGQVDSLVWFVNNKRISSGTALAYDFRQGTSIVSLKVYDNDLAMDSLGAKVNISTWEKLMRGPVSAGLSAASSNRIYATDEYVDAFGSTLFQLDSNGVTRAQPSFSDIITSTPSITPDTSLLVTNGVLLSSIDKTNNNLWPGGSVFLAGNSTITATVDSNFKRVYIGLSNKNFNAYDYLSGGTAIWSFQCDNQVVASAVISSDRKLIFPDASGTLYGFDISTPTSTKQGTAPIWKRSFLDSVNTSPAIDKDGFVYVGTQSGKMLKLEFRADSTIQTVWTCNLSAPVSNSPVIDANGFVYIGCSNGDFFKIDPVTGVVRLVYQTAALIKSTPAISSRGKIYLAASNGILHVIDTAFTPYWYYEDESPLLANVLHTGNTTYVGTMGGRVLAFWDDEMPFGRKKAEPEKEPMWGTFQGNARRTGAQPYDTARTTPVGLIKAAPGSSFGLLVYPNPSTGSFNLEASEKMLSLEIYNSTGTLIYESKPGSDFVELNAEGWNDGVYLGIVNTKSGERKHFRVLIAR